MDFSTGERTDLVGCGPAPGAPCAGGGGCGSPQAPQRPPGRTACECRAGRGATAGCRAAALATPAGSLRPDGLIVAECGTGEGMSNKRRDVYNLRYQPTLPKTF